MRVFGASRGYHRAPSANAPTPPSLALLPQLLRCDWDSRADFPRLDADAWTAVVRTALAHGVGGLLCRVIVAHEGDVPSEIVDAARVYLDEAMRQGAARVVQTMAVADALSDAGIDALNFKGVALGVLAHADARLRPSGDIDVLVHRDDMPRAIAALATHGYRQTDTFGPVVMRACYTTYGQDILSAPGRLPVEPHWTFAPRPFAVDFDLPGLWERRADVAIGDTTLSTLGAEDTLLVACLHGTKERWWRLLWIADVAGLIARHPALDWNALTERARRMGMLRMLFLGVGLAQRLFATSIPVSVAEQIDDDATCARLIEESAALLDREPRRSEALLRVSRFHFAARERVSDRMRYVARTIATPQFKHYRMVALPDALVFGYVPIKLVHDYLLLPVWKLGKGRLWRRSPARAQIDST